LALWLMFFRLFQLLILWLCQFQFAGQRLCMLSTLDLKPLNCSDFYRVYLGLYEDVLKMPFNM
jgi:hypothetical protein